MKQYRNKNTQAQMIKARNQENQMHQHITTLFNQDDFSLKQLNSTERAYFNRNIDIKLECLDILNAKTDGVTSEDWYDDYDDFCEGF